MYRRRKSGRRLRSSYNPYYRRYTPDLDDHVFKDDDLVDLRREKAGPMQSKPRYGHRCKVCNIVCTSAYQLDEHLLGMKHKANLKENITSAETQSSPVNLEKQDSPEHSEECKSQESSENKDSTLLVLQDNKDLYQFLECFEVASDSDVSFISKVAKTFRCALQRFGKDTLKKEVCQEEVPSRKGSFFGDLPITAEALSKPLNSEANTSQNTQMETEVISLEDLVTTCSDDEDT
ncbi:hypothetical protein XENTR_v10016447 [Xenopus tropicalis]|uniref:Uncharacterized protein LOC100486850 n=1 Tax=Xenopus tropicalis TaxID=8364 RepID=A0A8J0SS21_XENTR|eukprot:XP_012820960.1 PREDICTED: uncharacterized protein LOC100486850 [Xenopus tropicalis]